MSGWARSSAKSPVAGARACGAETALPLTVTPRLQERFLEGRGGKLRGVLDGQVGMEALGRHGAPGAHHHAAGPALEAGMRRLAGRRGRHGVVEREVVHIGVHSATVG